MYYPVNIELLHTLHQSSDSYLSLLPNEIFAIILSEFANDSVDNKCNLKDIYDFVARNKHLHITITIKVNNKRRKIEKQIVCQKVYFFHFNYVSPGSHIVIYIDSINNISITQTNDGCCISSIINEHLAYGDFIIRRCYAGAQQN